MIKKINWGYGIAMAYTAFACGMVLLVYLCVQQKIELVRPDYYDQELLFQQRIDRKSNVASLKERVEINYSRQNDLVEVTFPAELANAQEVHVNMYRPDDSQMDKYMTVVLVNNAFQINTEGLKSGLWRLQLSWSCDGKDYFQESLLNL